MPEEFDWSFEGAVYNHTILVPGGEEEMPYALAGQHPDGGIGTQALNLLYAVRANFLRLKPRVLEPIKLPHQGTGFSVLEIGPSSGNSDRLIASRIGRRAQYTGLEANPSTALMYQQKAHQSPRDMKIYVGDIQNPDPVNVLKKELLSILPLPKESLTI